MDERMSESAAEVIAAHDSMYDRFRQCDVCVCDRWADADYHDGSKTHAEHVLDALREAGWELIRPAEATHSGTVSTSFGWVTSWAKAHQVHGEKRLITVDGIHRCISADEARVLAAQLLAAAVSQDGEK